MVMGVMVVTKAVGWRRVPSMPDSFVFFEYAQKGLGRLDMRKEVGAGEEATTAKYQLHIYAWAVNMQVVWQASLPSQAVELWPG